MALFDKDKREARQQERATKKEEKSTMKRAEAMASAIEKKPTVVEEQTTVVQPTERTPGVTIVEASPDERTQQKTTTYTPEQVANSAILQKVLNDDNANNAANAILNEGTKKAESIKELNQTVQTAEVAKDLEEIEKNKLQSEIYSGPGASNPNLIPNASSTYLQGIGEQQGKPSYLGGIATKDDVDKDVVDSYAAMDSQVPQAVVEKLGVQDYYPQAGRDVAVGSFTGSRIGSQTIYSGAGVLLPMGLYDARKRALAKAANEKQAAVDKYFDLIDTADQYQEPFNVSLMDWMNDSLYNKHKGNSDAFIKDPTVRKEYARRKGLAKELSHYSTWSKGLLKDAADEKKYVTKEMVDIAGEIQSALVNNVDDVVSGKKDLGPLFAKAQVYQNIIPQIDVMLKQAFSESALGRAPINLRTGEAITDPAKFQADASSFLEQAKAGMDRDDFITGYKKFFTGDYEQAIDALIGSGKYSEEQREAALNYWAGQAQQQFMLDHKLLSNESRERAQDAQRNRQWAAEFELKKEQGKGYWDVVNESMNFVDEKSGKPITQLIQGWKNQKLSASQIQNKMLETARNNGIRNAYINPYTKSVSISMRPSDKEADQYQPVNTPGASLFVKERTWSNKSKKWVYQPKVIKYNDFLKISEFKTKDGKTKYLFENDEKVTPEAIKLHRDASRGNRVALKANEIQSSYGLMNDKTKNIETLNSSNIDQFSPNKAVNFKRTIGTAWSVNPVYEDDGVTQKIDPATGQKIVEYKVLPGRVFISNQISTEAGRKPLNMIHGDDYKSNGFGLEYETVGEGSYSSESSSDEE